MKFSALMGEPDSDPQAAAGEATSQVADVQDRAPVTPSAAGEPGFAQLNVTEPATATPVEAPNEADRLEGLETIDDDLLPRAPRRGRR